MSKIWNGASSYTGGSLATVASNWARPPAGRSWIAASTRCRPDAGPGPTTTTSPTRRPSTAQRVPGHASADTQPCLRPTPHHSFCYPQNSLVFVSVLLHYQCPDNVPKEGDTRRESRSTAAL